MVPPGGVRGGRPRLGGHGAIRQPAPQPRRKKRVLFVCIGNSCRSQMAEGFARAYGADVMTAQSAGMSPALIVAPLTKQVLEARNIRIEDQFPKPVQALSDEPFDVIVNMAGAPLPVSAPRVLEWAVRDPIGEPASVYESVAAQIEGLVMRLILEFRSEN